jgi:hypothetical protein
MMVAAHFDEREDGRFPSDEARAELQAALGAFVRSGGGAADEEPVCAALHRLADEAHERQLHGEHLLVAFKRIWSEMPEVRALREAGERQRLLDRLVTLCIDAYYRRG